MKNEIILPLLFSTDIFFQGYALPNVGAICTGRIHKRGKPAAATLFLQRGREASLSSNAVCSKCSYVLVVGGGTDS